MNDETNQDQQQPQEFKLPTKPIGRAGAVPMAIVPETMDDIYRMSKVLLASGMAPYHLKKPEEITVIIMHGLEMGMKPMMAIRRIAVIKGTPTIWGDAVPGLCQATGELEDWKEYVTGDGDAKTWHCEVKRKGVASYKHATFSIAQAKQADLWDDRPLVSKMVWENKKRVWKDNQPNDSPWYRHPERMMTMRTRVAFRDLFADVFNGLYIREELIDRDTVLDESGMRDVTPQKEGWKTVDNPMGDDPKPVDVEPKKNGAPPEEKREYDALSSSMAKTGGESDATEWKGATLPAGDNASVPLDPPAEEMSEERYHELLAEQATAERMAEEEQEGREAAQQEKIRQAQAELQAAQAAEETRRTSEKAAQASKPAEAPKEPPKAQNAPAASQGAATSGSGYFHEAMATIANAVDGSKLNTWWRGERQKRLKACSAAELEQLNDVYGNKFIALSKE